MYIFSFYIKWPRLTTKWPPFWVFRFRKLNFLAFGFRMSFGFPNLVFEPPLYIHRDRAIRPKLDDQMNVNQQIWPKNMTVTQKIEKNRWPNNYLPSYFDSMPWKHNVWDTFKCLVFGSQLSFFFFSFNNVDLKVQNLVAFDCRLKYVVWMNNGLQTIFQIQALIWIPDYLKYVIRLDT